MRKVKDEVVDFMKIIDLPQNLGDKVSLSDNLNEIMKRSEEDPDFSRATFLFSVKHLVIDIIGHKDLINSKENQEYVEHITSALMTLRSDSTRESIYKALMAGYIKELNGYGKSAQSLYESIYDYALKNKIWEKIKSGPWSWPLFALVSFVLRPTFVFNILEKQWNYDNGMKSRQQFLIKVRDIYKSALKSCETYGASEGKNHLLAVSYYKKEGKQCIVSNKTWDTDKTMSLLDNMIYLGSHTSENCAANFDEVLKYMELVSIYQVEIPQSEEPLVKISEEDCLNFLIQALHYYIACYARQQAEDDMDKKYEGMYPPGDTSVSYLIDELTKALKNAAKNHNAEVMKKQEEKAKAEAAEKAKKEEEMQKAKEKIKARHIEYEKAGFKLFSENNTYEKWVKDDGNQSIDRFFIKASVPNDRLRFFQSLEELGLSNGKIRNVKSSAGVIRYIKLGDEEVGTDTLVEEAYDRIRKQKPPVTKRETIDITDSLLTLAADKIFFSLEDLEKAADRIKPVGVTLSDIRGLIKMMRDRGIIGQVKTKKKGAKIFALTVEGMVIARNRMDTKLPLIHIPWSDIVGEVVNDYVGKSDLLEVVTIPVKNIDAMIEGKALKFLDKYYVTEL